MKTIKGLDEKPTSFDEGAPAEVLAQIPTYRKLFKAALGLTAKGNGQDAIDLYELGLKFSAHDDDISLEDADFEKVRSSCNSNPAQWISHYHAQVMLKIKDAEK